MNCCVPEFFLDEDPVFAPSVQSLADSLGEDFVELLWDNGPVFRRTSQEELRNRSGVSASCAAAPAAEPFLDEEMASWLNYQLVEGEDRGFGCHLDLPEKPRTTAATEPSECARRSPSAPGDELESPSTQQKCVRPLGSGESTIIDSNVTSEPTTEAPPGYRACFGGGKRETGACEQGLTSSSAVVCEAEASDPAAPRLDSQKRKAVEADESDSLSESINKKDDTGRSSSKRRLRAAEVHNLSERRRRDRINEKMKTLQELIPRCNKSDKASMLDDAIQYLKFLQAQVQMMSMGRNMYPMMVPGLHHHQYLPQMGMTMPMGMNMNMGMGISMGTFGGPMPSTLGPLSGVGRPQMGPFLARPNSEANPENVQQFAANRGQRYA